MNMKMKEYVIIMLMATAVVGSSALTAVGEPGNTTENDTGDLVPNLISENTGNTSEDGTGDEEPNLISEYSGATATNEGTGLSSYFLPVVGVIGIIALLGCIFIIRMKKKIE
jgi:hypothetical protein